MALPNDAWLFFFNGQIGIICVEVVFMAYDVKLKSGFFKTQQYTLAISNKQITLTPQEDSELHNIVITDQDLSTISITGRDTKLTEFEINAQSGIYMGTFAADTNIEEVLWTLKKEFGSKTIIEGGSMYYV
jgi:hypothetical protein